MEYQIISSLNRTNAFYNMVQPSLFGEMDLHPTKMVHFAVSGNPKNVRQSYTNSVFLPTQ